MNRKSWRIAADDVVVTHHLRFDGVGRRKK
jgi:hypothetical protein